MFIIEYSAFIINRGALPPAHPCGKNVKTLHQKIIIGAYKLRFKIQ